MTKRRIIYNDDGAAEKPSHNPEATAEGFLDAYFNPALGTQVDTWFYNSAHTWLNEDRTMLDDRVRQTAGVFGDANEIILEAARKADMEIFGSLRMNDIHCAFCGIEEKFKLQNPDLLIGGEHWPDKYPHLLESDELDSRCRYPEHALVGYFCAAYDFAREEVRQYRLDFIRQYCSKYDWDGLELDFVRHPLVFKPGEEEENLDTMTDFVRQVRATLNKIGSERGRPYLLAVRVPPTPATALRTGFDVERWLDDSLIDLLIAASEWSWYYSSELKEFVDMGHRCGVPVYLNCPHPHDPAKHYKFGDEMHGPLLRAICSNFWALGADGVYLFNYPYPNDADETKVSGWLQDIGDPETLLGLDKLYLPDKGGGDSTWGPEAGGYLMGPDPFPLHIVHGPTVKILVGDDVEKAASNGLLKEILLQVDVENMHAVEGLNIRINGDRLPAESIERAAENCFEARLQTPPIKRGINEIDILPGYNSIGRLVSTVTNVKIWVRYQ